MRRAFAWINVKTLKISIAPLLVTACVGVAEESSETHFANRLEGTWLQDISTQQSFNARKSILSKSENEAIACSKQKMYFEGGILMLSQPKMVCEQDGQELVIQPIQFKKYYRVIGETENSVVVEIAAPSGDSHLNILHFVSEDSFWTYHHGEDPESDTHLRIYYKRQDTDD